MVEAVPAAHGTRARLGRARDRALELAPRAPGLFWLFVVSRVIVASAMLNAALAQRRAPALEEVLDE